MQENARAPRKPKQHHHTNLATAVRLASLTLALLLRGVAPSFGEQESASPVSTKTRTLTVAEAIQLALTNNLNIRINQITPEIDQFTLSGLYSAYDPAFNFSAVRSINVAPGGNTLSDTPISVPPNTATIESYSAGISGALPTGLTYNLTGPLQWQQFTSGSSGESYYNSSPGIALDQPLLKNSWFNAPRYQISIARKNLRIDELALRLRVMTVINNVKAAYYNLIYSRENVRVQLGAVQLADQLVRENKKKVQLGALAPLDEKQAESQAASSQANLLSAEDAQVVQENVLKNLLTGRFTDWADVTLVPGESLIAVPEVIDLIECWRAGIAMRPDLEEAKVNVEKQHVTIKYEFNQLFPQVDVVGSYGNNATAATFPEAVGVLGHGQFPFYSYGVTLTVPLSNIGARSAHKAAKAALEQALLQVKSTEQTIVIAIDNDVKAIHSDLLRVDATRQARVFAEDALHAEQTKFEHGRSTSFVVLQLQSDLTSARSAEIRALADYNIALEQLALDEGTTFERNHIYFKGTVGTGAGG